MPTKEELDKKLLFLEEKKKTILAEKKKILGKEKLQERKERASKLIELSAFFFEDYKKLHSVLKAKPETLKGLKQSITNAVNNMQH